MRRGEGLRVKLATTYLAFSQNLESEGLFNIITKHSEKSELVAIRGIYFFFFLFISQSQSVGLNESISVCQSVHISQSVSQPQ